MPALELLKDRVDCLVTTVLAGGGSNAADAQEFGLARGVARVGGPGARRAWRARDAGDLHDLDARGLARLRRRSLSARHGLAGGDTRVRRAHHRGPLLLQGTPRRRLRPSARRSPSTKPTPNAPPDSPGSRRASPASGVLPTRRRGSPSCSPTTRPNTRGWATPSGWIPRRAPSGCSDAMREAGYAVDGAPDEG